MSGHRPFSELTNHFTPADWEEVAAIEAEMLAAIEPSYDYPAGDGDGRRNFPDRALYTLDNLEVLRGMNSETVDLIATDPPFNTSRNRAGTAGFYVDKWKWGDTGILPDQWKWNEVHPIWLEQVRDENRALYEVIEAAGQCHGDDIAAFLCFLSVRLLEMHRVLKPTGSLYLHCDHAANGYLRMALDAIFGAKNFRNEISWRTTPKSLSARQYPRTHDTIFFYNKGRGYTWNPQYQPHSEEYAKSFNHSDEFGIFTPADLSGGKSGGKEAYLPFKGQPPPEGRAWAPPTRDRFPDEAMALIPDDYETLNQLEKCEALDKVGLIYWSSNGKPYYKKYFSTLKGTLLEDVITNIGLPGSGERTGSPDQKPVALYERIISASSNPGDLVLDPFCGCATTLIAANNLGRRWVGIDRRADAAYHVANRLLGLGINVNEFQAQQQALLQELQFHCQILEAPPARTDDGETAPHLAAVYTYRRKPASMSRQQMMDILVEQWGCVCWGCGFAPPDAEHLELDHIDPASQGGSNELDNRCPLCGPCNRRKSNRLTLVALRQLNRRLRKWYGNPTIEQRVDIRLAREWAAEYLAGRAQAGRVGVTGG